MALRSSVGTCLLAMMSIATAGDSNTDLHARLATATRQVTAMRYDLRTLPKARAAEFRELFVAHVMTLAELDGMELRTGQAGKLAKRQQLVDAAALLDQFADELTRAHDRHNALHRYFTDAPEMATRLDHWRKFARANSLAGDHYDDVERLARDLQAAVGRGDFPSAATNLIPAIRMALDQALVHGWITASERDIDSDALAWILNDANIEPAYLDGHAVGSRLRIRLRMW